MDAADLYTSHYTALVTAQRLRQAGMNVALQSMDWSTLVNRRAEKKSIADGGWSIFHTFVANIDQLLPPTNNQLSGACDKAWFGWYCDPRIEDLRDKWIRATDPARQRALAVEIQERAYEQGAYAMLGQMTQARIVSTRLTGVKGPIPVFWGLKLE